MNRFFNESRKQNIFKRGPDQYILYLLYQLIELFLNFFSFLRICFILGYLYNFRYVVTVFFDFTVSDTIYIKCNNNNNKKKNRKKVAFVVFFFLEILQIDRQIDRQIENKISFTHCIAMYACVIVDVGIFAYSKWMRLFLYPFRLINNIIPMMNILRS